MKLTNQSKGVPQRRSRQLFDLASMAFRLNYFKLIFVVAKIVSDRSLAPGAEAWMMATAESLELGQAKSTSNLSFV